MYWLLLSYQGKQTTRRRHGKVSQRHSKWFVRSFSLIISIDPVPIETYFIAGNDIGWKYAPRINRSGELCHNLIYLGKGGRVSIHGLDIVFLSGYYGGTGVELERDTNYHRLYSSETCKMMSMISSQKRSCDILLIQDIPHGIFNFFAYSI